MQVKIDECEPSGSGLVALVGDAPHSWILVNALLDRFGPFPVLVEAGEPSATFWRRRARLVGPVTALGQRLARFPQLIAKPGARRRLAELQALPGVRFAPPDTMAIAVVPSVNHEAVRRTLSRLQPKAVFVCSTRIISPRTLAATPASFVNYHSGINPAYRGMYGGYHALAQGDRENFGTTLHLVDAGVDTGRILATHRTMPGKSDNFHTYVPLMAVESRSMVCDTVERVIAGDVQAEDSDLPSRQWFGPTAWSYLWTGLSRGIW